MNLLVKNYGTTVLDLTHRPIQLSILRCLRKIVDASLKRAELSELPRDYICREDRVCG